VNGVQTLPVRSARERRLFLIFPWRIYARDPLWVPPLLPERARILDPRRGPFFRRGEAELFLARHQGREAGTICAAVDRDSNTACGSAEALFGFFECTESYEVAQALLERAAEWARAKGLESLTGPYNLDYEDGYGALIEGRDRPPVLLCGHTPPYYTSFLERFGFSPARGDNLAFEFRLDQESSIMEKVARLAERIRKRGWITLRCANFRQWEREIEVVLELMNRSLAHLPDFRPWQRDALAALLAPFRKIADPQLILFAEIEGRTVGWFPGMPNLNEALVRLNGLRYPWDWLRVPFAMRRKPRCLTVKSVLILPEYWGSGAALLLFDEMYRRALQHGYSWADLSLTSADNPYTPDLAERFGARVYKRYRVYRMRL
jgi:GNAT superfamily N-acetyltransferase